MELEWRVGRAVRIEEFLRKGGKEEDLRGVDRIYLLLEEYLRQVRRFKGKPLSFSRDQQDCQRVAQEVFLPEIKQLSEEGVITPDDLVTALLEYFLEERRLSKRTEELSHALPDEDYLQWG